MNHSTAPTPTSRSDGRAPVHVVHVLGGPSPGLGGEPPSAATCAHLRSLAAGLCARGVRVTVHGPSEVEEACTVADTAVRFVPAHSRTEPEAVVALRAVLAGADVVHAHGLRAATLAGVARDLLRPRVPLVVTWHHREPAEAAREMMLRALERRAARTASVVLCPSSGLVDRARLSGARDARLAPLVLTVPAPAPLSTDGGESAAKLRAELGAVDRPLLFSAGRLDARHGYRTALTAARAWRGLDPPPLLAVSGDGPERAALQAVVDDEALAVRLLGRSDDPLDVLRAADLALLPAGSTPPLLAQEALRAGVPVVGAAEPAVRELVGDAGALTRPGDADALAETVAGLLRDPERCARLAAASRERGRALPTEEQAVAHVLSVYDEVLAR